MSMYILAQVFDGNSDTETLRVNLLQSPLLVRRIALQIVEYETTPTFRFDVYGYSGDGEYIVLQYLSSDYSSDHLLNVEKTMF